MMIRLATDGDRDAIFALGVAEEAAWFGPAEISAEEVSECFEMPNSVRSSSSVRTMARGRTSSLHHATGWRRALCPNDRLQRPCYAGPAVGAGALAGPAVGAGGLVADAASSEMALARRKRTAPHSTQ
jgi:hypothetical protein